MGDVLAHGSELGEVGMDCGAKTLLGLSLFIVLTQGRNKLIKLKKKKKKTAAAAGYHTGRN